MTQSLISSFLLPLIVIPFVVSLLANFLSEPIKKNFFTLLSRQSERFKKADSEMHIKADAFAVDLTLFLTEIIKRFASLLLHYVNLIVSLMAMYNFYPIAAFLGGFHAAAMVVYLLIALFSFSSFTYVLYQVFYLNFLSGRVYHKRLDYLKDLSNKNDI